MINLYLFSVRHFGPIQKHPTSPNVKGYPEFHVGKSFCMTSIMTLRSYQERTSVYRDRNFNRSGNPGGDSNFGNRLGSTQWHSDVSYVKQPPGTTFFFVLDQVLFPLRLLQAKFLKRCLL